MMSEGSEPRPAVAFVYVPAVDDVFQRVVHRGGDPRLEPTVQTWGDRVCGFTDPWDNLWWVATPGPE